MTYDELFDVAISNGCSPRLADMLASRSFPGTRGTDRAFLQGRPTDGAQFEKIPLVGQHHLRMAKDAGVSVTGKVYNGTLARYPGDPEAWVDSLGDVKRICEARGWEAEGAITVQAPRYAGEEPGPYAIADDLVEKYVEDKISENPDLAARRAEVKEEIASSLSGVHGR